jgi:hypothetical protein
MRVQKFVLLIAAGAAVMMLATAPGVAQTKHSKSYPIDPVTGYPIPPSRNAVSRSPAKVTVSRRSYLDPGKESKPPNMSWSSFPADSPSGIFFDPTDWRVNFHNRTPFPNCLDLPGFCR